MHFPELNQFKKALVDEFVRTEAVSAPDVRVIASPYRISPLGAHIDHQGGPVLGMTIDAYTLMGYVPAEDGSVDLKSRNYSGTIRFDLEQIPEMPGDFWGRYARGAALALREGYQIRRGLKGYLDGMLPGCGLSSSASVLLAYLQGLAHCNNLDLKPWDYVHLTRRAENHFIGLNNGILDQTSIVFGKQGRLLYIDTEKESVLSERDINGSRAYRILVAYSGYSRELTTTGYNSRVSECRAAAKRLAQYDSNQTVDRLSQISVDTYNTHGHRLPADLRRRAAHFFGEVERVHDGIEAWREGRLNDFGALMTASCRSSIEQYECGTPAIHDLQKIVVSAEGVIGARFGGGGFGGCVIGLVAPSQAQAAAAAIKAAYVKSHPEVAEQAAVYLTESADGIRAL